MELRVGLQMISVQKAMIQDPLEAIRSVSKIGYHYLEFANHRGDQNDGCGIDLPAAKLRETMEECGLKSIGCHVVPFDMDNVDRLLSYHSEVGTPRLTACGTFYSSRASVLEKANLLNRLGERCRKAGITLSYHNHFQEYQKIGNERIIDVIMQQTDPVLVDFQMDTYWVLQGGYDPVEELQRYGDRVKQIHQKDMLAEGMERLVCDEIRRRGISVFDDQAMRNILRDHRVTEIGCGVMDIQRIIHAGVACGAQDIILEQDYRDPDAGPEAELKSIAVSMKNFQKMHGVTTK